MYLVAIGWLYVVTLMALAEALSAQGSVLGALITFVLYGALPLALVLYLLAAPMRRRARLQAARLAAERETRAEAALLPTAPRRSRRTRTGGKPRGLRVGSRPRQPDGR